MTAHARKTAAAFGRDIRSHSTTFQKLVGRTRDCLEGGRFEEAALCGKSAAAYAWYNHPGVFASRPLEQMLLAVGRATSVAVPSSRSARLGPPATPMHVLHIMTQAYPIGGHTRLVWRWIQGDPARTHSVALTSQGGREVPPQLREGVRASGGALHVLDTATGSLVEQAKALRTLAVSSDRIVLHIHPHDVVPLIALARGDGPSVIFLNHADHVFWLGACITDVVANLRESGLRLARDRRGFEARRCVLLPLPLPPVHRTLSRQEAKRSLGFSEDSLVILSVASAYKYTLTHGVGFADALAPVLGRYRHAVAVVVGPELDGPWRSASVRAGGRLLPVGVRDDVTQYYQAADVYVDSFPFSSPTALLEAGSYGVPVVSYCPHPDAAAVLCTDDLALSVGLTRVTSIEHLRDALAHLIEDEAVRDRLGERARDDILRIHTGARWKDALEAVYLRAAACAGAATISEEHEQAPPDALDAELVRLHIHPSIPRSLEACVIVQIAEGLASPDLAPVTHLRGYAMTMLQTFPWLIRSPSVRSSVASVVSRLAIASDKPLRAARQMCTALRDAVSKDNAVEKPWVRRLLAAVWEDVAVTLSESRGAERAAASAAARALLSNPFEPSPRGRKLLVRLLARGAIGDSIVAMPESRRRRSSSH